MQREVILTNMPITKGIVGLILVLAIAGCSRTLSFAPEQPRPLVATQVQAPVQQTVSATPQPARQSVEIIQFIDPVSLAQLSESDKSSAANAQFYALQFGRPGAPRSWRGSDNVRGNIVVGPYISINGRDCRQYTHTTIIESVTRKQQGTSCRQSDGTWVASTT